jgi:S-adenosylmethionine synthetase
MLPRTDRPLRDVIGANDTSAVVGYAPLIETERLVLAAKQWLYSAVFQQRFPGAGEDVKVMGVRRDRKLTLTVAFFNERFVPDSRTTSAARRRCGWPSRITLPASCAVWTGSRAAEHPRQPSARRGAMYLMVLGTSAEGGDCGQVGRGNRVSRIISLSQPISTETAAGTQQEKLAPALAASAPGAQQSRGKPIRLDKLFQERSATPRRVREFWSPIAPDTLEFGRISFATERLSAAACVR